MSVAFVQALLGEGRLQVDAEPAWRPSAEALRLLEQAFANQTLHVPGPPLEPVRDLLVAASAVTYRCGWLLLSSEVPVSADDPSLTMPRLPRRPDDHLSVDLLFRFLPGLYQRAKAKSQDEELAAALARLLRQWPLSGVLADLTEPPETPVDFGGHAGLCLLYAERLAVRERVAWLPPPEHREHVELVWQVLGKNTALLRA